MNRWLAGGLAAFALTAFAFYFSSAPSSTEGAIAPESPAAASAAGTRAAGEARGGKLRVDLGTRVAAPATTPAQPTRLARLGWGSAPDQVGRRQDPESAAEGPMAIAAGRDGTLYILDQQHGRVLRRAKDGSFGAPIVVGSDTLQDLRATNDGLAVLDRLGEKSLRRYDASGQLVDEKPLASFGVADPGGTTGLFVDGEGALFVEESLAGQGRRVVHPLAGGAALPGRPSRDGKQLLTAQIVREHPGTVRVIGLERSGAPHFSAIVTVPSPVLGIVLCDSDVQGGIYVGVLHAVAPVAPARDFSDERLTLFRLDANGAELAQLSVPHPPSALESFRELELADVGIVWWMHPLPDGSGIAVDALKL